MLQATKSAFTNATTLQARSEPHLAVQKTEACGCTSGRWAFYTSASIKEFILWLVGSQNLVPNAPSILLKVPLEDMKPVILRSLCMHDYESGEAINDYDLSDYKEKWGYEYYMFHRQDMHKTLLQTACGEQGEGPPAHLFVNHKAAEIDVDTGRITFENGKTVIVDLIIGADGVRVSTSCCLAGFFGQKRY